MMSENLRDPSFKRQWRIVTSMFLGIKFGHESRIEPSGGGSDVHLQCGLNSAAGVHVLESWWTDGLEG